MYLLVFQQNYDRKYVGIFDDVKKARKHFQNLQLIDIQMMMATKRNF